jgi:hypothetical protein
MSVLESVQRDPSPLCNCVLELPRYLGTLVHSSFSALRFPGSQSLMVSGAGDLISVHHALREAGWLSPAPLGGGPVACLLAARFRAGRSACEREDGTVVMVMRLRRGGMDRANLEVQHSHVRTDRRCSRASGDQLASVCTRSLAGR